MIVHLRLYILQEKELQLINNYSLMNNKKYVGNIEKVLVEGINEKDSTKLFGYTETMKLVNFEGTSDLIGKIIDVEILDAKSFSLDGKIKR